MPSITGIAARGPMSPSPSTAVPSETTATVLRLIVYWKALVGVFGDREADARYARRVGHREVVARLQRVLVVLLDLAAHVQQERAVGRVDHLRAVDRFDRGDDLLPVVAAGGVHDDVAQAVLAVGLDEVDGADHAAGVADRSGDLPEDAGSVAELDADGQAILRAWGGAH